MRNGRGVNYFCYAFFITSAIKHESCAKIIVACDTVNHQECDKKILVQSVAVQTQPLRSLADARTAQRLRVCDM